MKTIQPNQLVPCKAAPPSAFTLAELLAIVAIVAVLACLQLPALAKATNRTKRAQCAGNLHQIALALHTYAGEYNDKLPTQSSGTWAWDMSWGLGDLLTRFGAPWPVWYCPGTAPRYTATDNYRLFNYLPQTYRVVGYALTLPGTASLNPTNVNVTLTPQATQVILSAMPPPLPSKRVLAADVNLTPAGQSNPILKSTYNWTGIQSGYTKTYTSPHLNGFYPAGGNSVMLDAHVEWGPFSSFLPRTTGNVPVFWW